MGERIGMAKIVGEAERRLGVEQVEDVVDQLDQPHAEGLEGLVPLTVPMRVRHEVDRGAAGGGCCHGRVSGTRGSGAIPAHSPRTQSRSASKEQAIVRLSPARALR